MRYIAVAAVMGTLFAGARLHAKCARLLLDIAGEVKGATNGDRIGIAIDPDPNEKQPEVVLQDGRFSVRLRFDPTRAGGRTSHDCSRRPKTLTVTVCRGDQVLKKHVLDVERDLEGDENGRYILREPLILDLAQ